MYVWNGAEPWRDGDLEAGIVIHGASSRFVLDATEGADAWFARQNTLMVFRPG